MEHGGADGVDLCGYRQFLTKLDRTGLAHSNTHMQALCTQGIARAGAVETIVRQNRNVDCRSKKRRIDFHCAMKPPLTLGIDGRSPRLKFMTYLFVWRH